MKDISLILLVLLLGLMCVELRPIVDGVIDLLSEIEYFVSTLRIGS